MEKKGVFYILDSGENCLESIWNLIRRNIFPISLKCSKSCTVSSGIFFLS